MRNESQVLTALRADRFRRAMILTVADRRRGNANGEDAKGRKGKGRLCLSKSWRRSALKWRALQWHGAVEPSEGVCDAQGPGARRPVAETKVEPRARVRSWRASMATGFGLNDGRGDAKMPKLAEPPTQDRYPESPSEDRSSSADGARQPGRTSSRPAKASCVSYASNF